MEKHLYFAYGSNLNPTYVAEWSPRLAAAMKPVGRAWLPDHDLAFTRKASSWKGGVLDVIPARGSLAPGFLFQVDGPGLELLDVKEGVASGAYERFSAMAFDEHGEPLQVWSYRVCRKAPHIPPSRAYLNFVRGGRQLRGMETHDLARVARGERRANALASLFTYGTLLRGEQRFGAIAEHAPECCILAEAIGDLRDCGSYPGFVYSSGTTNVVHGEFVRFNPARLERALEALDLIEGFDGFAQPTRSLFIRRPITVGVGGGRCRRAWVYELPAVADHAPIASGDWRAHRLRREPFLEKLACAHVDGIGQQEVAARFRNLGAFGGCGPTPWTSIAELIDELASGAISERRLAQATGRWTVLADPQV